MTNVVVNPVGTAQSLPQMEALIENLVNQWVAQVKTKKPQLIQAFKYLLDCLDDFIQLVENLITNGPDKKATVLAAVTTLYVYVMANLLPFWLAPFAGQIESFIINTVIGAMIDFIVNKYNTGNWTAPTPPAPTTN